MLSAAVTEEKSENICRKNWTYYFVCYSSPSSIVVVVLSAQRRVFAHSALDYRERGASTRERGKNVCQESGASKREKAICRLASNSCCNFSLAVLPYNQKKKGTKADHAALLLNERSKLQHQHHPRVPSAEPSKTCLSNELHQ